jgi:hypothetical protein
MNVSTVVGIRTLCLVKTNHAKWDYIIYSFRIGARNSVVVEESCYKREGRGFEIRCGEWIFFIQFT